MKLVTQKRLASKIMDCSARRIKFDPDRLSDIKEAITRFDISSLIKQGAITRIPVKGVSRVRAKKRQIQKRKGNRRGTGKRKGKATARQPKKRTWINAIRLQRKFLKTMRDKAIITSKIHSSLYKKAKGGFFRSKQHLKIYMEERDLLKKGKK
jgi:large subunit ribosomal protein L19e